MSHPRSEKFQYVVAICAAASGQRGRILRPRAYLRAIYRAYSPRARCKSLSLFLSCWRARSESSTICFDTRNKRSPRLSRYRAHIVASDTRRRTRCPSRSGRHVGFNEARITEEIDRRGLFSLRAERRLIQLNPCLDTRPAPNLSVDRAS